MVEPLAASKEGSSRTSLIHQHETFNILFTKQKCIKYLKTTPMQICSETSKV